MKTWGKCLCQFGYFGHFGQVRIENGEKILDGIGRIIGEKGVIIEG